MKTAKRIAAVCVTAVMVFQMLAPSTDVLSQEVSAVTGVASAIAYGASSATDGAQGEESAGGENGNGAASDGESAGSPDAGAKPSESDGAAAADKSEGETRDPASNDASSVGDAVADVAASVSGDEDASGKDADSDVSSEEVDVQAASEYKINSVEELKNALGDGKVTANGDAATKIKFGTDKDLLVISNTKPEIYQAASIEKSGLTGVSFDLSKAVDGYEFMGFGSAKVPFGGTFSPAGVPITLNKSLFNNIKLSADASLNLVWKGSDSQPVIASQIDGNSRILSTIVSVANPYSASDSSKVMLTAPLLGTVAGSLTLETTYQTESNKPLAINVQSSSDNIGLLANTVDAKASFTVGKIEGIPDSYEGTPTITTTKDGANAGGLIGECGDGATVAVNKGVDISQFAVYGKNASGGFIGKGTNLTLRIGSDAFVKPARVVGNANSSYSGGIVGDVRFAGGYTVSPSDFTFDDVVTLGARYRAGCLFGKTDISNGDIVVQGGTYKSQLTSGDDGKQSTDYSRGSYGGLVGNVFATSKGDNDALRALVVQSDNNDKVSVEFNHASALCYAGGVAGYVGDKTASKAQLQLQPVAVVLDGVFVACKGEASARQSNGRYGGAVGVVDMNDVLDVRDFALTSESKIGAVSQYRSADIAGSAWIAIIKFSGITDLSGAIFAENATTGQLVNENYNSLIFADGSGSNGTIATDGAATGWTLKRSNTASKTDDLATYGEVLRLGEDGLSSNLLKLDSGTHILTKAESLARNGNACTLADKNDFAKLAITWQTNGYYSMAQGVSHSADDAEDGLGNLTSSTIAVNSTIDLSGTGLTGLTKDRVPPTAKWEGGAESSQLFSGKLTGNGTIDLAVGEPYGMRGNDAIGSDDTTAGNGKIYRHGRLGLFGGVTTNAAIENVAIGGFMKFENGGAIDAGAVTGTIAGNSTFSGVKVTTNIAYTSSNDGNVLQVGGIAGSVSAAATVDFTNGTETKAAIAANGSAQGETRIGGAIGYVAADATSTLNVSSLKIGGAINAESESKKVAQIGGFIGSIGQGAAGVLKTVSITGLAFDGFQMSVGKNGDTKNGAGGLLGYSWGNATVTIGDDANNDDSAYALTTNNTSITANSAAEFGGLLYAMSGHLVIQNRALDLSNAVLSATSATSFGVLLAYGSTSANNTTFGVETYTGLYLEDKTPWDIAYKVANGDKSLKIEADNNKVTCFDEWVAAAAKPGSTTSDNGCNGVVSLHTEADTLNMTGNPESDNSYRNRTKFGESHQTNANTRYYYNLDRCWAAASGQIRSYNLTTPEGLMVWNLLWYAPATLDEYMFPGVNYNQYWPVTIGSGNGAASIISLEGYSYYPTNINCGVSIKNVTIRFCYSQIKQEQANNKTNYKTERDSATQHTNMHAALIRTYSGTNTRTLSLEDVCLTGSTGIMVKDSRASSVSGALVCRLAYGTSTSPTSISINRLVLDGLKVDGVDAEGKTYAPLLINEMPNYITLDVKGLSVKKGSYGDDGKMGIAASSLFGRLGGIGTGNTLVNASLSNGVAVPSRKEAGYTIFSRASFFESFAYGANLSGSASYIFNQGDAVTYGKEIDSKGEYPNKQLWYYDASGYGSPSGPGFVTDGSVTAEFEEYNKFANYLPYVYTRHEDGKNYHEVKVNQRAADLVKGCGTYSDPYSVQTEQEIYSLTNYINDANSVVDGWQVTITSDQSQVCDRRANGAASYEATYKVSVSNNRTWTKVKGPDKASATLDNSVMHRYLQSAYYYIDPASGNKKIELDAGAFNGFGSLTNPFRGVIVGKIGDGDTNNALEIEASGSANKPSYGLIPYSYGSVVRNLSISYSGTNTIGYKSKDTTNGTPGSFFGGVIGCIMGGDNIVDGVNVTGDNCTLSASGGKSYLVPMGGYIGAICGGGVIFRNMGSETSWRSLTKDTGSLYDNPYVGRVIDGYAFSEGCTVDNGNDDYKVNQLDTAKRGCVTTKNTEMAYSWEVNGVQKGAATVSIQNSQGLMILSAIINSGAGAGAAHTSSAESGKGVYRGSRAYEGRAVKALDMQVSNKTTGYYFGNEQYGKVRNASYASVGDGGISSSNSEWATAKMDDQRAPGYQDWKGPLDATQRQADAGEINSPYLVKKYANWATGEVCAMGITGLVIEFAQNLTFDMRGYGSAYRGLSGRYFSNACVTANMDAGYKYWQYITPSIACIKGNGATIAVTNNFKEYTDDDFKVSGLGALFDNVMFKTASYLNDAITQNNNSNVDNLSFASCDLSIDYVNGTSSDKRTVMTNQNDGTKEIGVGCLAGVTTNQNDQGDFGIYKNVSVDSCNVRGGASAGGLIGTVGYRAICGTYDGSSSRMTQGSGVSLGAREVSRLQISEL